MSELDSVPILFDTGHGEEVSPEDPELSQFVVLLEGNGFQLKTSQTTLTSEILKENKVVVLGNPLNATFSPEEFDALESFVKSGGGLLLVSGATIFGKGGDIARKTNLNEIANRFSINFADTAIADPSEDEMSVAFGQTEPFLAIPSAQHPIVEGIRQLEFVSGTSIQVEDVNHQLFRIVNKVGSHIIVAASESEEGRLLALGGATPFFNSHIKAHNHEAFIIKAFQWLAGINVNLPANLISPQETTIDIDSASESIQELQNQIDMISRELNELRDVINTTLKDMQQIIEQLQKEKK